MGRSAQSVGGGEDSEDADPTLPTDWATIGFIAAALVAYLLLIERAGFIIASSVLFFGAAFAYLYVTQGALFDSTLGSLLAWRDGARGSISGYGGTYPESRTH